MTPFQDEIARIIRTFSEKERIIFEGKGGSVSSIPAPEPEWFKPGVDKAVGTGFQQHVTHHRDTSECVKVKFATGGTYTVKEAAALLNVTEHVLRNRLNRADEIEVRGMKLERLPRRSGKAA